MYLRIIDDVAYIHLPLTHYSLGLIRDSCSFLSINACWRYCISYILSSSASRHVGCYSREALLSINHDRPPSRAVRRAVFYHVLRRRRPTAYGLQPVPGRCLLLRLLNRSVAGRGWDVRQLRRRATRHCWPFRAWTRRSHSTANRNCTVWQVACRRRTAHLERLAGWYPWSDTVNICSTAENLPVCLTAAAPVFLNWRLRNL